MKKKNDEAKKSRVFKDDNKPTIFAIILGIIWLVIISIGSLKENFGEGLAQCLWLVYAGGFAFIVMTVIYSIGLGLWLRFTKQKEELFQKTILMTLGLCIALTLVNNNINANKKNKKYMNTYVDSTFKYCDADIEMEDYFNKYEAPDSYYVPNYINFIKEQLVEKTDKRLIIVDDSIEYNGKTIYLDDTYDPYEEDNYVDLTKAIDKLSEE